ncbi:hypothetical protein H6G89_04700 [Oscillatoria sp. FACHB-1407]|uniref:hypothetical protein n=1 Tax=Oscillatoria sp. FACHB-1407 TaxID=2692847 RepID=UPI001686D97B|nr:hypothetical protein [Oscillatoria sp. FACHB-1407]MBD2460337.1 hypothetical protein [Oscillatoria sp. FACHB-1407]
MKTQWMVYCELELIPNSVSEPQPTLVSRLAQLKYHLGELWASFVKGMTQSPEPHIWQESDRQTGNTWWCAYDPITQQSLYAESEGEVLEWLERRPYC